MRRAVFLLTALALAVAGCTIRRAAAPESTRQIRVAGVRRVVDRPALSPAVWSPDGTRFAFGASDGVYVAGENLTPRRIAPAGIVTALSWSSRLDLLALVDRGVLWTVRPDGRERRQIVLSGFATAAAWAPGSDRLAVVVRRSVDGVPRFELWLLNRNGGFRRFVVRAPLGRAIRDPQWFPDSLYLAYGLSAPSEVLITEAWRVRIANPDHRPIPLAGPALDLRLAPSGRRIAYVTGPEIADGRGQVVVSRLDGRGRLTLTPAAGRYTGLAWSPQGDKLAMAQVDDEAHARIWISDGDGSGRLLVYNYAMEFTDPSIAPTAAWSPDGRKLLFGTNTGTFTGPIWLATLARR